MPGRRIIVLTLVAFAALLGPAAAASGATDIGISQTVSAHAVKPGGTVTVTVTATNLGDQPANPYGDGSVDLNLFSWGAHAAPTNNPYQSVTPSQGSCNTEPVGDYKNAYCTLGPLAPGASAQVTAVVQVNESANNFAQLLGRANSISDYSDDNGANDAAHTTIYLDKAPIVAGPKTLKIKGLPGGCVSGDFTLDITAKAPQVKEVKVSAYLGLDANGDSHNFSKTAKGKHLKTTFPASKVAIELNKTYTLKVKAKLGGGHALKSTVTYVRC
jgi:hypothetical protein